MGRLTQLLALQYSVAGDPKKALEIYQRILRETANAPGAKGYQFATNRQISSILIQMGDIAQAEAYLRRSLAAIQEARTSGLAGMAGILCQVRPELGSRDRVQPRDDFRSAGTIRRGRSGLSCLPNSASARRSKRCSGPTIRRRSRSSCRQSTLPFSARPERRRGRDASRKPRSMRVARCCRKTKGHRQVQSRDTALRRRSCRHSGRAGTLRRSRAAGARCHRDQPDGRRIAKIRHRPCNYFRSLAAS